MNLLEILGRRNTSTRQTCQAALSAPGACRQATPNRVTTAVADACAATAHGRHATNVRFQGRNASGMARSLSGLKALTLTAMSIRLQVGGYPTTLILPPLLPLRATIINQAKTIIMTARDPSLNLTIATSIRWRAWFSKPNRLPKT
ncbi:hypothetical protein ACLX1H_010427 [Fusarium chlamydosporum]